MNRAYWEAVSADYERKVMSVFTHDAAGVVLSAIAEAGGDGAGRAADIGCGVGMFTLPLAKAFSQVEACDIAQSGLDRARERCGDASNVRFWRVDLTRDPMPFEPVDFVLCVNVLMMPALDDRLRAWRAVANQVRQGGRLLLVAPSLESVQLDFYRAVEARLDRGESCEAAQRLSGYPAATAEDLQQGVHLLEGIRTKHYLRDELMDMLSEREFEVKRTERLVYSKDGDESGGGLWDWMVVADRL